MRRFVSEMHDNSSSAKPNDTYQRLYAHFFHPPQCDDTLAMRLITNFSEVSQILHFSLGMVVLIVLFVSRQDFVYLPMDFRNGAGLGRLLQILRVPSLFGVG